MPLVATNDVLYHTPERRPLQDVLSCIRAGCTIGEAGFRLAANAERHLKSPAEMARLFRSYPDAVARSVEIVERCKFSLDELRYEYPDETAEDGRTPQQRLADLAWAGAAARLGDCPSPPCRGEREGPIAEQWEGAVGDGERSEILHLTPALSPPKGGEGENQRPRSCPRAGISRNPPSDRTRARADRAARLRPLFPDRARHRAFRAAPRHPVSGRGSAANSVVCYCLGITAVDPARIDVLFERFISAARNEPPDIDVDFEHERREEVIQYIYEKYGRDRAGLAATVICYRSRSAIREVGKALGLSVDVVAALAGIIWGWSNDPIAEQRVREAGLDPGDRTLRLALDLAAELTGFPRHSRNMSAGL